MTTTDDNFEDLLDLGNDEAPASEAATPAPEPETSVAVSKDIDTIASEPVPLALESGFKINVERLRTRQTMKLLKILTAGAGDVLGTLRFSEDADTAEFTGQLLGAMLLAIPDAEEETVAFIRAMVNPRDLIEDARSKPEKEVNENLLAALDAELENPELGDLVTIVEQIVKNEAPHILALGKRLALLLNVQQKSETAKQSASSKKSTKG